MKKKIHVLIMIFILISILTMVHFTNGPKLPIPKNYSIVDYVLGDLDKDLIPELVVVYNTEREKEIDGIIRELIIYKLKNNKWKEWKKSDQAVLGNQAGGMMGDPFQELKIKKGILIIKHRGGTSWIWDYTDKYRFQDGAFYLIGYTEISGKEGEDWQTVDYNLSTGKIIYEREYIAPESKDKLIPNFKVEKESFVKKGLKITIQNRHEWEITIRTPKYGNEIYIANGND